MSSILDAFDSHRLSTWFSSDDLSYIHTIPSPTSPGGARLETWCRVECVGEGAYGKVHREICSEGGAVRAVKVIKKACLEDPVATFMTELSALARMSSHPDHFVQLFGWFQDEGSFYIAMEYMQCGDLGTMIKEFDGLSRDQVKTASKQLLLGLQCMHTLGFCHRDLKPQNILVATWFPLKVKIADFGTTKVAGARTPLTTFIGTPDYLAPEILDPMDVGSGTYEYTNAVDIWSLGCLVYTMAAKQPPFPGRRGLTRYTSEISPFPGKELEAEMRRFIISLMRPRPQDRPTATAALKDRWLQPDPDTWGRATSPQPGCTQVESNQVRSIHREGPKVTRVLGSPHPRPKTVDILKGSQAHPPHLMLPTRAEKREPPLEGEQRLIQVLQTPRIGPGERPPEPVTEKPDPEVPHVSDIKRKPLTEEKIEPSPQAHIKLRGDALIEGAANGRKNIVQSMLEKGADISYRDRNGDTALHRAIQHNHKDIVLFLLHRGADQMVKGFGGATPLITAARSGSLELARLLLNGGSDLLATDINGFTALHVASQHRHLNVVSFILGLDPRDQMELSADKIQTPRGISDIADRKHVVRQALEMRGGPLGFTVLHSAASTGDLKTVKLLLDGGADVGARADDNSTPLTLAATDGHYRIVKLLLDRGADITERGHHKYTALHLAVEVGHIEVAALLLERGADTTAKEDRGYTALQRAAASGFDTIVELLISWDMGTATKALAHARPHHSSPAPERTEAKYLSAGTAGRDTYTITITRQTDRRASSIELRKSRLGEERGADALSAGGGDQQLKERKLLEQEERLPTHGEHLSVVKQIPGEPVAQLKITQMEANSILNGKQAARKVGKIQKVSCVIT